MNSKNTSEFKGKQGFQRVVNATRFSYDGFTAAWRTESAFRQVCLLALIGCIALAVFGIDPRSWSLIIASHLVSMAIELLNSAIEAAVDHTSLERHPLAKRAKDMGSAAQFVCLGNLVIVWSLAIYNQLA